MLTVSAHEDLAAIHKSEAHPRSQRKRRDAAAREYAASLRADPKDKTAQEALRRLGKA